MGYVWKTCAEIIVLPLTYQAVKWMKHHEPTYQQSLDNLDSPETSSAANTPASSSTASNS